MRSWAVPAAIIVAIQYVFAVLVQARVGYHYERTLLVYLDIGLYIIVAAVTAYAVARFLTYAREKELQPTRRLLRDLPRCSSFVLGTLLVTMQMAVLTWTKIMLPMAVPFWAGAVLAGFDHALFGIDPWRIAAAVFGWAAPIVDTAYISWLPIKFVVLAMLFAAPESERKTRLLVSYFLIIGFTAIGQYLLSSAGPVFYERLGFGNRFSGLHLEPWVKATSSYLWDHYRLGGVDVGAGISAMPSLHVAIALWLALAIRAYAPRIAFVGYSYYAVIFIGSVLLGWHFFADGIAATAITLLAWRIAARNVTFRRESSRALLVT
jgi:PAP2 superfamily protein